MSAEKLLNRLKENFRKFWEEEGIKEKIEEIMACYDDPDDDSVKMPEDLVLFVDAVNDIDEMIKK